MNKTKTLLYIASLVAFLAGGMIFFYPDKFFGITDDILVSPDLIFEFQLSKVVYFTLFEMLGLILLVFAVVEEHAKHSVFTQTVHPLFFLIAGGSFLIATVYIFDLSYDTLALLYYFPSLLVFGLGIAGAVRPHSDDTATKTES